MNYPTSNQVYPVANAVTGTKVFITYFATRSPTSADINYQISQRWFNITNDQEWILISFSTVNEVTTANWQPISSAAVLEGFTVDTFTAPGTNPVFPNASNLVKVTGGQVAAGTTPNVIQTDSLAANTYTIQVQRSQAVASSTVGDNGVCHFNSAQFTVDTNAFVSILGAAVNYTNVTHAMSPYTVLSTDYYISVDCSAGTVQLDFPNAPTFKQIWIVKDRTGNAALNNITLTTPGGSVTFDGLTTYTMNSNYQAINLLANATPTYEVY